MIFERERKHSRERDVREEGVERCKREQERRDERERWIERTWERIWDRKRETLEREE